MQGNFYNIKPAVDTEETGNAFPAVSSFEDYDFKSMHSVHQLDHWSFPNHDIDIRFKLAKGAKLCDVMGQATIPGSGLLVSKKFKIFLEKFNLGSHMFLEGLINNNKTNTPYFWLHVVWNERENIVDYKNSSFYKKKYSSNLGELNISTLEEFKQIKTQLGSRYLIGFDELVLLESPKFDLWPIPFRGNLVISNTLRKAIEESKFTGINISKNSTLQTPLQA